MRTHRRIAALLLAAALLLTACTGTSAQEDNNPNPTGAEQPAPSTPPTSDPEPEKPEPAKEPKLKLPIKTVDGAMEQTTHARGEQLPGPGLYLVETATGQAEGWMLKTKPDIPWVNYGISPDNRWILAEQDRQTYLTDRSTRQTYTWVAQELRLVHMSRHGLLFEETTAGGVTANWGTGRFHWVDERLEVVTSFNLPPGHAMGPMAVVAPDGRWLAIASGWTEQGSLDRPLFYLVELAEGEARPVGAVPKPADGAELREMRFLSARGGQELAVMTTTFAYGQPISGTETRIDRYGWDGKAISSSTVRGSDPRLSPDGRLLAWQEQLHGVIPTVRVVDAATGDDRFRILGAAGPIWEAQQWLAGGDRFLVGTQSGPQIVTNDGKLVESRLAEVAQEVQGKLVAAPDQADLFASQHRFIFGTEGPAVVDVQGKIVQQVQLPDGAWRFGGPTPWGDSSKEFRFAFMPEPGGDGWDGVLVSFPPKVDTPPYSEFLLQVRDPAKECLNLRAGHNRAAQVVRCLPDGTKLSLADATGLERHLVLPSLWDDGMQWLYVQTEAGETGWVSLSAEVLGWAE